MNSSNIHFATRLSVSASLNDIEYTNNYIAKFISNKNLNNGHTYFKHYKALQITNEMNQVDTTLYNRVNPSISILGYDGSIPYITLSRQNTDYFIRVNNKSLLYGSTENTDILELCCDTLTGNQNRINYYTNSTPSFLNHYKAYNLLTFGEVNNICIKCNNGLSEQSLQSSVDLATFTNATNKVSIGFPYGIVEKLGFTINEWPQYFNNTVNVITSSTNKYAPFMMNVFGNTGIYSIYGKTLLTVSADDGTSRNEITEKVTVNVGTLGDIGNIVTIYGELGATKVTNISDSNVKTDLKIIENALNKVNNIAGYTFMNTQTSNMDTGLIAQEVQQILPEAVQKNKDDLLTISYGNMMGLLVESVKELTKKIDMLDKRISMLES
jgi:hypothetical protein